MRLCATLVLILIFFLLQGARLAEATAPCGSDTWFMVPDRPDEDWNNAADLVFLGRVDDETDHLIPFPNCGLSDKSQCAVEDMSVIHVTILAMEKGSAGNAQTIDLIPSACSQIPPKLLGSVFRFYTRRSNPSGPTAYIFYGNGGGMPDFDEYTNNVKK